MRASHAILLAAVLSLPAFAAAGLKPFSKGSLERIQEAREGKPFLLVLWSVDCPPCIKELTHLQAHRDEFGKKGLVLVSTDGVVNRAAVEKTLGRFQLTGFDNWIFADDFAERLRYEIDPDWFGELPRSYRYDSQHRRTGVSGALKPETIRRWLSENDGHGAP